MSFLEKLNGREENTRMIKVKLFGIARDIVGAGSLEVSENINSVDELLVYVRNEYPDFTRLNSLLVAINEAYAEPGDTINENDVVALIPPVSGG